MKKTIYICKVNGELHGGRAMCGSIACGSNQCKAHGNYKCPHKVKEGSPC